MAYALPAAHSTNPLRAFSISIAEAGATHRRTFTALARSSSEALRNALALPDLNLPVAASVKPVGSMAEANRVIALKMALADLVE